MAINVSILEDVILLTVTGSWDGTQGYEALIKSSEAVKANRIYRLLLDIRQAEIETSTLDIYMVTSALAESFPAGTRHAVLQARDESLKSSGNFFETVAANRGVMAKTFSDKKEALRWLRA
ncbi:MAG: hypothetical protein ACLFPE_14890 [Bacteroidales bacterium]